jgi:hypothetical protein
MARNRSRFQPVRGWLVLCLAASMSQGCARPRGFQRQAADADSSADAQKLPFHPSPDHASDDGSRPEVPLDRKAAGTPFHSSLHPRSLPAGSLITVQLGNSLVLSQVRAGDKFEALTEPVTIDGDPLVGRGTPVSGRVEAVQPPAPRPGLRADPGYLRLSLNTITVEGRAVPLKTSSLFAQGTLQGSAPGADNFRVLKGRRLTFRLTAPVVLGDPNSIANRQLSSASTP